MPSSFFSSRNWFLLLGVLAIGAVTAVVFIWVPNSTGSSGNRTRSPVYAHPEVAYEKTSATAPGALPQLNPAAQKAGPPDSSAQKKATVAATRAAEAAANLAASAAFSNN